MKRVSLVPPEDFFFFVRVRFFTGSKMFVRLWLEAIDRLVFHPQPAVPVPPPAVWSSTG